MSVGAKDHIDKKLVKMYANVQTITLDINLRLAPERILDCMSIMASNNQGIIRANRKMNSRRKSDIEIRKTA